MPDKVELTRILSLVRMVVLTGILFLSCAAPMKQFYPDRYYDEDQVYENKLLRFTLTFTENWILFTDPTEMDKNSKEFHDRLRKSGVELLFTGATSDGLQGVRGIAVNLNESLQDYASQVRSINLPTVQHDSGLTPMQIFKTPMIKWRYSVNNIEFAEFFFTLDTYDVRIAFFAHAQIFQKFYPVYEEILTTLETR